MNKYNKLLDKIADTYHIARGDKESDERWKARVVYSLLGRMALASLSDDLEENEVVPENGEIVSIAHFKGRIQEAFDSYLLLYPELNTLFPAESKALSGEIYDIFLKTGCIYHTAYRITSAAPAMTRQGGVQLERGMPLERKQYISGLGAYLAENTAFEGAILYSSAQEMFGLQEGTLSELWTALETNAVWSPLYMGENMEYLSHTPPFQWNSAPSKDVDISIARLGQPGGWLYYLYRMENGWILGSQLPHWLVNDPFYGGMAHRTVVHAYLAHYAQLPAIHYKAEGATIQTSFAQLLPPAELYWIRLYSWPLFFASFPSDFKRVFSLEMFQTVKEILEQIGYQFKEE